MRKTTILLALIGLTVFAFGQESKVFLDALKPRGERANSTMNSHSKGIVVEIIPVSKYQAGKTMDLVFNLTNTSPDDEWVDYVELTLPNGIKPIGANDPFMAGYYSSALNEISGQEVSWGTDRNDATGGIEIGTHPFFVTVEIDNTVSGDQTIEYKVSGDHYGASDPHDVSGNITVKQLPNFPDLKIKPIGFIAEYYAVPLDQVIEFSQVTSTIQAIVTNEGAELTQATNATVSSSGDYIDEKAISIPLNSYDETQVVFADFKSTKIGTETFTFKANASDDFDTENGIATADIEISETDLIRDNGEITNGWSIGGPGYLGNVFTINSKDTLNSVTLYLTAPTIGDVLFVDVFEILEDGTVGEKVAGSVAMAITAPEGEFTAYFAGDGVIMEAGKYLFAVKEGAYGVTLAATTTEPYVEGTAWLDYGAGWIDLGGFGYPLTFYIRPGFGTELPAFDMAFYSLDMYKYAVKGTDLTVEGTLINKGVEALNTIDISYTVNDGTPVTESFTDLNSYGLISFSLTTPIDLTAAGDYNVKVYLTNPNGADDADVTNDTTEIMVSALEYAPHKNIVGEEATGTWCGWCVRGHVFMDYMAENYQDTWIGIAVHNYDPMVVDEYDAGIGNYIPGYPSALINRMGVVDPSQFEEAHNSLIDLPSPVGVEIANVSLDAVTGELTFDVSAEFLATLKDAHFNAVIIENNVTGDGDGYNQANYYSGGTSEMGGYEDKPNPVLAEDMVYQNVARAILGGWDGTDGSIPATVNAGDKKSYTYSITMDAEWNVDEIKIVGMVIGDDGSILNAAQVPAKAPAVTVTFNIDMTQPIADPEFFVAGTDVVYVTGSFNGWDQPGTGESILMSDTDGDKVYTATVQLDANIGEIKYKYFKNTTWDFGDNLAGDRPLTIADADITTNDTWVHVSDVNDNYSGSLAIYPNPVINQLTVQTSTKLESIRIYNVVGLVAMEINNPSLIEKIDMHQMAAGVYFIEVVSSQQQKAIYKISKQ